MPGMMEGHPCIAGLWALGLVLALPGFFGYSAYVSACASDCADLAACNYFCSGCEEVRALEQGLRGPARATSKCASVCSADTAVSTG